MKIITLTKKEESWKGQKERRNWACLIFVALKSKTENFPFKDTNIIRIKTIYSVTDTFKKWQ